MKKFVSAILATTIFAAAASPASAAYLVQISQSGANVVISGSGSLNLAGLTPDGSTGTSAGVGGASGLVVLGSNISNAAVYRGFSGPASFGTGSFILSEPETGKAIGLNVAAGALFLDSTYESGTAFGVSTATFANTTIASLGLTSGTYVYRFGAGATADRFTVNIGQTAAVPETATWGMMIAGFGMMGAAMRTRRRSTKVSFA